MTNRVPKRGDCRIKTHIGDIFGRWTVIDRAPKINRQRQYLCRCLCGDQRIVDGGNLRSGASTSCGCSHKDQPNRRTHGQCRTRLYGVWCSMKRRCDDPHNKSFAAYGGRGISVCQEWQSDFTTFRDWALAKGYAPNLSIDRINVNGNYEPHNCRWATNDQQARNKRTDALYNSILKLRMICT